jgi:hypothetical protein
VHAGATATHVYPVRTTATATTATDRTSLHAGATSGNDVAHGEMTVMLPPATPAKVTNSRETEVADTTRRMSLSSVITAGTPPLSAATLGIN